MYLACYAVIMLDSETRHRVVQYKKLGSIWFSVYIAATDNALARGSLRHSIKNVDKNIQYTAYHSRTNALLLFFSRVTVNNCDEVIQSKPPQKSFYMQTTSSVDRRPVE